MPVSEFISPPAQFLGQEMQKRSSVLERKASEISVGNGPVGDGLYVIVPVKGGDRLGVTLGNLLELAKQAEESRLELRIIAADWALTRNNGLSEFTSFCQLHNLPVQIVTVPPLVDSPGRSFNVGVEAVLAREQSEGLSGFPLIKGDDDSAITNGTLNRLHEVLKQGYVAVAPRTARTRTMEELLNSQTREEYRQRFDSSKETPQILEILPDRVFTPDGFDLATVMASWHFPDKRMITTENYLTLRYELAAAFQNAGTAIFIPQLTRGEGYEWYIQARRFGKLAFIRNLRVVDRPDTLATQNVIDGINDAVFAQMLQVNGLLQPGLQIVTRLENGCIAKINAPVTTTNRLHGVMVFPEQIEPALHILQQGNSPDSNLESVVNHMVVEYNSSSKVGQIEQQPVNKLIKRLKAGLMQTARVRVLVQNYVAKKTPIKESDIFTSQGKIQVSFPFGTDPENPVDITTVEAARASTYHTLGALAAIRDPNFVMVQH